MSLRWKEITLPQIPNLREIDFPLITSCKVFN